MTFSQGTIWIKSNGQVGLRLDDLRVDVGQNCPFNSSADDGQLNVNPSTARVYSCPGYGQSVGFAGTIRRIELRDQNGNLLAMPGNQP